MRHNQALYPSEAERWSGCWYIQSKFHKPNLSKDSQKWLLNQIKQELKAFKQPEFRRKYPDNWIVATNVDPSGTPQTGSFDKARELVAKECPELANRFHIWGGRKILDLLALHPQISDYYRHFLTPGNVLSEIYDHFKDSRATVDVILRFLIATQLDEHRYTKLEQAGSSADVRPGIHNLFIDLPFRCGEHNVQGSTVECLVKTAAKCHRIDEEQLDTKEWRIWNKHPLRSRVWFIRGGPGHGKSTITQFFCQIQRAALILDKGVSRPSAKQKTLATEIRRAVEKKGFWTSVPRIPISIELKEFAQWFGQQNKNESRGILTYLAQTISAGVEQKVETGILKRLLETRSWVIVFDGLDEVPQDVKDAVASEVCRFVNDVAVEINSDLLTLCTSRPQGYSGQFEDLDGPTIELTNLSPEKALECATPVLKIDRTSSEVRKASQILRSAIESPAVSELMTTPLQAHIMAVVVRDGEIPPERRWKLFTNFYQVIKKRESNRNLPDKSLAKLLREDEQLLKTIHNRLGFILHARAESSQGAQTKLDRDEFKKLATEAVSQMVETEIIKTIDVLMKATVDRLVLVSTPDDGNNVRFDIRPLQEFFAAEFLYESVNAEALRERIELIAGDAHWREVMHFLLSALIENGRRTELAVVIEVLDNLNEGDGHEFRLLRQRLGIGALLTARLLHEGVLEQDKRIRRQFGNCLKPLAASTEIELLQPLIQVSQTDSVAWLNNFLISCLQENNQTENIGAAIVLVQTLPDHDSRAKEVSKFLLLSSFKYLACVINALFVIASDRDKVRKRPLFARKWFIRVVFSRLMNSEWSSSDEELIRISIEFLSIRSKEVYEIAKEFSFSKVQERILQLFLNRESYLSPRSFSRVSRSYGIIELYYEYPEWTKEIAKIDVSDEISNTPLILQLIYYSACFKEQRTSSYLIKIFDILATGKHLAKTLFDILGIPLAVLSILNQSKAVDERLETLTDAGISQFFLDEKLKLFPNRRIHILSRVDSSFNMNLWRKLIDDDIEVAIHLWATRNFPMVEIGSLDEREILYPLIKKVVESPIVLKDYSTIWGKLLAEAPEHSDELRNAILEISSEHPVDYIPFSKFFTFKLNLPTEAPLLPHLLNALLVRQGAIHRETGTEELIFIREAILEMVDDTALLSEISVSLKYDQNIRAAATLALFINSNIDRELGNLRKLLIDFYNPEVGFWYTRAITNCLCLAAPSPSPDANWIVSNLLEAMRGDYQGRQCIQKLFAVWRESSTAPIQKAGVQEKWLSSDS